MSIVQCFGTSTIPAGLAFISQYPAHPPKQASIREAPTVEHRVI